MRGAKLVNHVHAHLLGPSKGPWGKRRWPHSGNHFRGIGSNATWVSTPAELRDNYTRRNTEHKTDSLSICKSWLHPGLPKLAFLTAGCGRAGLCRPPGAAGAQPWETRQFSGLLMSAVVSGKAPACEWVWLIRNLFNNADGSFSFFFSPFPVLWAGAGWNKSKLTFLWKRQGLIKDP